MPKPLASAIPIAEASEMPLKRWNRTDPCLVLRTRTYLTGIPSVICSMLSQSPGWGDLVGMKTVIHRD